MIMMRGIATVKALNHDRVVGHRDRENQIMIMMRGIATVKAES